MDVLQKAGRTLAKNCRAFGGLPAAPPGKNCCFRGGLYHASAGLALVFIEVLNDYGAAVYFGVPTLSTQIFKIWFTRADYTGAALLSWVLLVKAFSLFLVLRWIQRYYRHRYADRDRSVPAAVRSRPVFLIPLILCFIFTLGIPLYTMLNMLPAASSARLWHEWREALGATLGLNGGVAGLIVVSALGTALLQRFYHARLPAFTLNIGNMGYAIPGAVMAMAVLPVFLGLDQWVLKHGGWYISQSLLMVILALFIRYFAIGNQSLSPALQTLSPQIENASINMDKGFGVTSLRLTIPLLKPALVGAFVTTWVDLSKDLPITLILRPFNFHTLATRTFEYAEDEFLGEAALFGLTLILLAAVPYLALKRNRQPNHVKA